MQYISSFFGLTGPSDSNPNVFLYDSRETPDLSVPDLDHANDVARTARSVLAFNGFVNPVRGRKDNKYYLCPLKYTQPKANLIEKNTDIVQQTGRGTLSGESSIAADQSYMLGLGNDTTIYLCKGAVFNQPITCPPASLYDTNCPYGQSGTMQIGLRYVIDSGSQFSATASVFGQAPFCSSAAYQPVLTSVQTNMMLLQIPLSVTTTGSSNGFPGVRAFSTKDGATMYQTQTGDNESVTLDRAFCYLNEFRAFVKFNDTDFTPVVADPGTRPRIRFKTTRILGI